MFKSIKSITSVTLPSTITSISNYAFIDSGVQEINIPQEGLETIGLSAFRESALRNFVVPSTVYSIGESAFGACENLSNLTFLTTSITITTAMLTRNATVTGAGDGTLLFAGDYSSSLYQTTRFANIIINGNLNKIGSNSITSNRSGVTASLKKLSVKGDVVSGGTSDNAVRIVSETGNAVFSFFEVFGTITVDSDRNILSQVDNCCTRGLIVHLGYDAYTNNSLPCAPNVVAAWGERVRRIFVGKGESESEDNNIKSVYLANSDWSQYSYKIGTWYEYLQEEPPEGSTRLVKVTSNALGAYIDTGVSGNNDNLSFRLYSTYVGTKVNYSSFMGNYVNDNSNCWCIMRGDTRNSVRCCTNRLYSSAIEITSQFYDESNNLQTIEMSLHSYTSNGVNVTSEKASGTTNATNILLGRNGTRVEVVEKDFHGFKIWDNGVKIRDYIPCRRDSDGAIGFWEAVNGEFKTSDGNAEFVAGLTADFLN